MPKLGDLRRGVLVGTGALLCLAAGGCGLAAQLLNPEFLTAAGLAGPVATVPGEAPAVLVEVDNRTVRRIEAQISWREQGDEVGTRVFVVGAGGSVGEVLICPVTELTIGDVANLDRVGAIVRLGDGDVNDPILEIEPFGVLLQEGVNYDCGDSVTFQIIQSGNTGSGYQIIAFIQRAGP